MKWLRVVDSEDNARFLPVVENDGDGFDDEVVLQQKAAAAAAKEKKSKLGWWGGFLCVALPVALIVTSVPILWWSTKTTTHHEVPSPSTGARNGTADTVVFTTSSSVKDEDEETFTLSEPPSQRLQQRHQQDDEDPITLQANDTTFDQDTSSTNSTFDEDSAPFGQDAVTLLEEEICLDEGQVFCDPDVVSSSSSKGKGKGKGSSRRQRHLNEVSNTGGKLRREVRREDWDHRQLKGSKSSSKGSKSSKGGKGSKGKSQVTDDDEPLVAICVSKGKSSKGKGRSSKGKGSKGKGKSSNSRTQCVDRNAVIEEYYTCGCCEGEEELCLDTISPTISMIPSYVPSVQPSDLPSSLPSQSPSDLPSQSPSDVPSKLPSQSPSDLPSQSPSDVPSDLPSQSPSDVPSGVPSNKPSDVPSHLPSQLPSDMPSDLPSELPSELPSDVPSNTPSVSSQPSRAVVSVAEPVSILSNPSTPRTSQSESPSFSPSVSPRVTPLSTSTVRTLSALSNPGICQTTATVFCDDDPSGPFNEFTQCFDVPNGNSFAVTEFTIWLGGIEERPNQATLVIRETDPLDAPVYLQTLNGLVWGKNSFALTSPHPIGASSFCIGVIPEPDSNLGVFQGSGLTADNSFLTVPACGFSNPTSLTNVYARENASPLCIEATVDVTTV